MRIFNVLAVVPAAMLMAGAGSPKEKPADPKPRKVCRTEQMPGRITPRRVCRIVPPAEPAAEGNQRKGGIGRGASDDRN